MTAVVLTPGRGRVLLNFTLFQVGWFVCVLGAARGSTLLPVLYALGVAAVSLAGSPHRARLLAMLRACSLLGLVVDGLLVAYGSIGFPLDPPAALGMPLWIGAIWLLFATTFDGCMAWLRDRPALTFVAGAVGSPLSYRAAESLGALEVREGWTHVLAVGLAWGLLLVVQFRMVRAVLPPTDG